jgi:hypothetical protein
MYDDDTTRPDGQPGSELPVRETEPQIEVSTQAFAQADSPPLADLKYSQKRLLTGPDNVSRATSSPAVHSGEDAPEMGNMNAAFDAVSNAASDDDFDLKISDLPPTRQSHYFLLKLGRLRARLAGKRRTQAGQKSAQLARQRSIRISRVLTASAVVLIALVLLAGNIPVLRGRFLAFLSPTPTPASQTTYFSQVVINNGAIFIHRSASPSASTQGLGPMPQRCPRVSTLLYFTTPLDPPGLGAGPVWLSGFTGPTAALDNLAPLTASQRTGWYETLAVFIQKGFTGTITLTGASQQNKASILLGKMDPRNLVTTLTLNLNSGDRYITDGAWEMASVTLAIPAAGCYRLHASWGDNAWDRYFAAGA